MVNVAYYFSKDKMMDDTLNVMQSYCISNTTPDWYNNGPLKMSDPEKILIIKLGALGDFIIALGAMKAIRSHHPDAYITLLTTKPFASLAKKSNYVDEIQIDRSQKFYQLGKWIGLDQQLNNGKYDRVYDLQMNDRTRIY